jgi:hypothetical protein
MRAIASRRLAVGFAAIFAFASIASACTGSAWADARWALSSRAAPTNLPPGKEGLLVIGADDLGNVGVRSLAHEVTITDVLPHGVRVADPAKVNPHWARSGQTPKEKEETWKCVVTQEDQEVTCATSLDIPAYERLEVEIPVLVTEPEGTVATVTNQLSVSGGEAEGGDSLAPAALTRSLEINGEDLGYGVEPGGFSFVAEEEDGALDTQAGSHPYQLTSTVDFNETLREIQLPGQTRKLAPGAPALSKNLTFRLPPGLLGNVTAAAQCSDADFAALEGTTGGTRNLCPGDSAIGVATVSILVPSTVGYKTIAVPIFNLEPAEGEPARFGFEAEAVPVVVDTGVATESDYGVTATVSNATAAAQVLGAQVTFWGDPGDSSHDGSRGWACLRGGFQKLEGESCEPPSPRTDVPFLTLPTSCTGQLASLMTGEAWIDPGEPKQTLQETYVFQNQLGEPLASLEGCPNIPFEPALNIQPQQEEHQETSSGSTPTGLDAKVALPQTGTLTDGLSGEGDVRSATVTLPAGVLLNPAAANGLEACSEEQVGYEKGEGGIDPFSPGAPEPLHFDADEAHCPKGSKVGTVRIKTPLLGEELTGSLYLAEQTHNPFGSLIALYVVAESRKLGLTVKLAGEGHLDESTGQISTTFANTPQVPFEELELELFGGPRGPLSTPALCGAYSATSTFESWSGAVSQPVSQPGFAIRSGPGGGSCLSDPLPFAPSVRVGSSNVQAGAYTPFTLDLENPDGNQQLGGLTVHLPTGIAAMLANVTPCAEPLAGQEWACGADSLIGHSQASSGLGVEPFTLPGSVYLTTGYGGAPFGLLVSTPAKAGPFDLGVVNVRSRIFVDPDTAAVTIVSDPFPTYVKGVPAQIKEIHVAVDRPEFEFNPTSCNPASIAGTLTGSQGGSTSFEEHFQVQNCGALSFHPSFTAQVTGQNNKANGAGLTVRVGSSFGQANVGKAKVIVPATLPARLSTLQKACTEGAFDTNPASCPEGSVVGTAIVHTPVLKSPLTGPAYLVSHGNAAFPDLEFVLQGEGIKLILDGKTAIHKGVTSSSFESVPDAPVTSFETVLPQGPHSALTANVAPSAHFSLCGRKLVMPTTLVGQNGTLIKQNTKIAVQGCAAVKSSRAKKLTRTQQLALALKHCRKTFKHNKHKRTLCERQAHKRYAPKKAHRTAHRAGSGR